MTTIKKNGVVTCKASFNGIKQVNPRTFIKKMISVGSFNPRALLDKATREEKILSLIPIKIEKKDVIRKNGKPFPVQLWEEINFEQHAWKALTEIKKDMVNVRESLYREKELLKKSFEEEKDSLLQDKNQFFDKYKVVPKSVETPDEEFLKQGKLQQKQKELNSYISNIDEKEYTLKSIMAEMQNKLSLSTEELNNLKIKLEEIKQKISGMEEAKKTLQIKYYEKEKEYQENTKKRSEKQKEYKEIQEELQNNDTKIARSKEADYLMNREKRLEQQKQKSKIASDKYTKHKEIVADEFPILIRKLLEPIKNKVPGLEVNEEGKFTYKGISLDTLSGSENVLLGAKLYMLDKRGNFFFLNEAECMDQESTEKLSKLVKESNKQVIAIRVADKPTNGEWTSTKMDK